MYDDLARTQQRSLLEQIVVRFVIPSLLTSFVMECREPSGSSDGMTYITHDCFGGPMRRISSVASFTIHAALGAVFLLGTTKSDRTSQSIASQPVPWVFPVEEDRQIASGSGITAPDIHPTVDLPSPIPLPPDVLQSGASMHPAFRAQWASESVPGSDVQSVRWDTMLESAGPEVLAGPLPRYPELLRQAGVEGQVVLEAVVDSSGRVQRASVSVVSATHDGFVEPARQSLRATLFRPARVNGRAVPMLVRVPFAFSLRGGTGRTR